MIYFPESLTNGWLEYNQKYNFHLPNSYCYTIHNNNAEGHMLLQQGCPCDMWQDSVHQNKIDWIQWI